MSFFGIGKKKLDEQSREEQSAETAKVQKEQAGEDAPKSARLSEKIMEQQQWEDSLRRFVKSESARQQNNDEEQNEEHRAVEDLKRALLNGDEKVEESSADDELTEEQVEEQERRSLLAALGAFPQESEEPVEVEQVAEGQDIEEDAAPVAEEPKPATPAFLRDDEEAEAEGASVEAKEASAGAEESKDVAEEARSQFEEHLRALRAQKTEDEEAEESEATAPAAGEVTEEKSENAHSVSEAASADDEDSLTVEDMKAARTHAAVTEAQNAGLDDLAAAYAARLGITLDSEEETFGEVASNEVIAEVAADEAVAEEADSAEALESTEATEPVKDAEVSEASAPEASAGVAEAAEDFETEETVDLTAGAEEAAEPATTVEEEQIEAVVEAPELLASELTEEENAVSDETELLSAVSVEEKHEASVSEPLEAKDFDAEEENTAELIFDASAVEESTAEEPAAKVSDSVAEGADSEESSEEDEPAKSASVAPALAAVAAPVATAAAVASAAKAEEAEEKTEKSTSQSVALTAEGIDKKEAEKHEAAAREQSAEEPAAELKETEQKLSEDEAELVAESIILGEPVEGAATLPVLPEQRALHGLAELMRTRGSGTMSLELRQVDEDMHYRLLHRGREIETGIVVPGVDWFAPVAALYTEAQQAGATWNRAAVSLKPRLGDGLEVHASYLGTADGQTTGESFLLGGSAVEAKPVATAEAAEATLQDESQEAAVQSVDSVEAEREAIERELEAELAEKQAANEAEATVEAAEEPVVESAEEGTSSGLLAAAGLAAAGTAVAGSAVADSAQEKEDVEEAVEASDEPAQTEFAPVEAEFEHDYENDPVFGAATVESETGQAEELTAEASETSETSAQASVESGEDMEAALAAIVANAQKKLDAEEVSVAEGQKAAAPVVAESFTLDRIQPVEEVAEEPAAEQSEEPALPAFLDDAELLPEHEASAASAEAHSEEPALEDAEPAAESASVAPGLAGALAAAAAVGTAGAAAKATEAKASEAKGADAQEEPAAKVAELKTVEVTPATKIAEAPAAVAPASEATAQAALAAPAALPETAPAGLSSSISASALSEHNQLPTIVAEPDTPSAAVQSPLVPSETQLASGNLVLTEAQVAQRLAPVVEHLFGENGTAKDATTVLIRVRALGSYYDALTHVRRNGFWEQVRTFELIPETLLDIPALKTDSYSEGEGSPLAMSLTFTPGVPVQAAFDYANEQAFVTYPRPLDAERYVEELRMFPRLGSKIPAHMTSALSHWNL